MKFHSFEKIDLLESEIYYLLVEHFPSLAIKKVVIDDITGVYSIVLEKVVHHNDTTPVVAFLLSRYQGINNIDFCVEEFESDHTYLEESERRRRLLEKEIHDMVIALIDSDQFPAGVVESIRVCRTMRAQLLRLTGENTEALFVDINIHTPGNNFPWSIPPELAPAFYLSLHITQTYDLPVRIRRAGILSHIRRGIDRLENRGN